jgi:hypothetical protein
MCTDIHENQNVPFLREYDVQAQSSGPRLSGPLFGAKLGMESGLESNSGEILFFYIRPL